MNNIADLQDYVGDYFEKEFAKFYDFKLWKNLLVMLRAAPKNAEAFKLMSRFGDKLKVRQMTVDVRASNDEWAPTLSIEYEWEHKDASLVIRVIVVKQEIYTVQLVDSFNVCEEFGEDYNFVNEFEKSVVLINALKQG
jgi:hypothetical protein